MGNDLSRPVAGHSCERPGFGGWNDRTWPDPAHSGSDPEPTRAHNDRRRAPRRRLGARRAGLDGPCRRRTPALLLTATEPGTARVAHLRHVSSGRAVLSSGGYALNGWLKRRRILNKSG